MHQGREKRFLLIDASERTASSPCKKPLFARIRRRVGRITAVGEIAAKHLPQRNHAQRGQHGTKEKGVPVVPRQLIEHPAEKRSENDVADRQQHREGRVELSEEFAGKELLSERRRKGEKAAGDDSVDHQQHAEGAVPRHHEPAGQHRHQIENLFFTALN